MADDAKATAVNIVTAIAAAGNVILFLSQAPMVYKLMQEGDATRYTWLPSLTLMSTLSLWSGYTVYVYPWPNRIDIYIGNFSGVFIPFTFLVIFVVYSKTWRTRAKICAATAGCLAATWGFCIGLYSSGISLDRYTQISGGVVTFVNMLFFISPLKAIYESILTLDGSRLPVSMSLTMIFQAVPWIVSGLLINDLFILGVNATGCAFGCIQTAGVLFIRWRRAQLGLAPGQHPPWVVSPGKESAGEGEGAKGLHGGPSAVAPEVCDDSSPPAARGATAVVAPLPQDV